MKLGDLFRRQSADDKLDDLEAEISNVIMLDIAPSIAPDDRDISEPHTNEISAAADDPQDNGDGGDLEREPVDVAEPAGAEELADQAMSSYAQSRLAELSAFEELNVAAMRDIESAATALAHIKATQHQTRVFIAGVHAAIHRANELERANGKLVNENRLLFRQAEQVKRLKDQHEALIVGFRHRETKLHESLDEARHQLSSAKLDLTEALARVRVLEGERQDALTAAASAQSQQDLVARELEIVRGKQVHHAADLEAVSRKRTEAERRVDELETLHGRDAAEVADLRAKLHTVDGERASIQRQFDSAASRVEELSDHVRLLESDLNDRENRFEVSYNSLLAEREGLVARMDTMLRGEAEQAEKISQLQLQLSELKADNAILSAAPGPRASADHSPVSRP